MIQLALRSSIQAEVPFASTRSARIDGSATAVIISSRPARKTPAPNTASNAYAERRIHDDPLGRPGHCEATRKPMCLSPYVGGSS